MKTKLTLLIVGGLLLALLGVGCLTDDDDDDTPPVVPVVVESTIDGDGLVADLWDFQIGMEFNTAMDEASLIAATSITYPDGLRADVDFEAGLVGNLYGVEIDGDLEYGTTYTVTIGTGAESAAGEAMAEAWTGTFTTVPEAPIVMSTSPADGATDVVVNTTVTVVFSRRMDEISVLDGLQISPATSHTSGVEDEILTIVFSGELEENTEYTITIDETAHAPSGPAMTEDYEFSFTTGTGSDETPPTIVSYSPANGATNVSATIGHFSITFSEPIVGNSLQPTVMDPRLQLCIVGEPTWDATGTVVTGVLRELPPGAELFVDLAPFLDLAGNASADPEEWSFTVAGGVDWFPSGENDVWEGRGIDQDSDELEPYVYRFQNRIANISGTGFHMQMWVNDDFITPRGFAPDYEHDGSEFYNRTANWLEFTGMGDWNWDEEQEEDVWVEQVFSTPVNWLPLGNMYEGYTWNGTSTMDMDEETEGDLVYNGEIVGFTDVTIEMEGDKSRLWSGRGDRDIHYMLRDCAVVYLSHVITGEIDLEPITFHDGWDSLCVAPGVGVIGSHSFSEELEPDDDTRRTETHENWEWVEYWSVDE